MKVKAKANSRSKTPMDKRFLKELGLELSKSRKRKDLSRANLADETGFNRSYIADIEQGKRNIPVQNLYRIGGVLGIKVSRLIKTLEQRVPQKPSSNAKRAIRRARLVHGQREEKRKIRQAAEERRAAKRSCKAPQSKKQPEYPDDSGIVESALCVLSPAWTTAVLIAIADGPKRVTRLLAEHPKLSPKTLTMRLRTLEKHGFVNRESFREVPPRVEYSLTEQGKEVLALLEKVRELSLTFNTEGLG